MMVDTHHIQVWIHHDTPHTFTSSVLSNIRAAHSLVRGQQDRLSVLRVVASRSVLNHWHWMFFVHKEWKEISDSWFCSHKLKPYVFKRRSIRQPGCFLAIWQDVSATCQSWKYSLHPKPRGLCETDELAEIVAFFNKLDSDFDASCCKMI